jgi:putative isomerase
MNLSAYKQTHEHIQLIMPLIKHGAEGCFGSPYLSVTHGQHYGGHVYSWDNHHMSLRFAAGGEPEQMRYFLENMLALQKPSGFVPCIISADNGGHSIGTGFHAQPFLAQNAAIYAKLTGDVAFVGGMYGKLRNYLDYWLKNAAAPFGLFRWRETYMSGFDNEIVGTIFQMDTIISPDLNAWLYLEMRAMAYLSELTGNAISAREYRERADALMKAINEFLWDDELGTYAAYDLCIGKTRVSWSDGTLSDVVGTFAYLSCPALIPLFAGIAAPEQAERMIKSYVLNPNHFRSPYGIRSLSRSSEYYNNAKWGNPRRFGEHRDLTNSNWQGPVWILLNWFVFHALLRYGFTAEAEQLADDTFKVVAMSLNQLGYMRENFDGETGEPLYADYFASWNILADLMPDYLPGGKKPVQLFF